MADNPPKLSEILHRDSGSIIHVNNLTNVLRQAYVSAVQSRTPRFHPDRARICQILFMKEREGSQHEYILAFVTVDGQPWVDGASTSLGVIRCERSVNHQYATPGVHMKAASSNLSSSGSSTPSSSSVEIPAVDSATIMDITERSQAHPASDVLLYEHHFHVPSTAPTRLLDPSGVLSVRDFDPPSECPTRHREDTSPPSLYDLAAACIALHAVAPTYVLLDCQCYWFAAMIYYMLGGERAAKDPALVKDLPHNTLGSRLWDFFRTHREPSQGEFHNLFNFMSQPTVLSWYDNGVRRVFDAKLRELYQSLREAVLDALQDRRALEESRDREADKDRALEEAREREAEKDRIIAALQSQLGQAGPSRAPEM
ncbi:hypothetical protein PYCCODRAFT_1425618 [Trametes coccinea BRFM310]|uniref:Uncharacterized protein n=1 Tax=Trametes coccinea (strain BRFM310) TaxID=1353009 RepID=A0A1Y2ILB5_TRAC3|nr:hypothetical protein PYCCODRAFT_1425618 [Trametes coccinea BRFM310]